MDVLAYHSLLYVENRIHQHTTPLIDGEINLQKFSRSSRNVARKIRNIEVICSAGRSCPKGTQCAQWESKSCAYICRGRGTNVIYILKTLQEIYNYRVERKS